MADFNYRGVLVEDVWSAGSRRPGSQTRYQHRRREDGAERWAADLPSGAYVLAFTRLEAMEEIREALATG